MNFHLKNGIYFRKTGDELSIVKASSFDDAGEVLVTMTMSDLSSIVASASKCGENGATFGYIYDFLTEGIVRCAGCGNKIDHAEVSGRLGVINVGDPLWIVGRVHDGTWDFQGVFSDELTAASACADDSYFVAPSFLNQRLGDGSKEWEGAYFPLKVS